MYSFSFYGGMKSGNGSSVKFLAFPIVNQEELSLSAAKKYNIVRMVTGTDMYESDTNIIKIFSMRSAFGSQNQIYSFFVKMGVFEPKQTITIRPFQLDPVSYKFKTNGRFLSIPELTKEKYIAEDSKTLVYLSNQERPPLHTLKQIVQIEREAPKPIPTRRLLL